MPIYKELSPADIHTSVSTLNQLVDVIQEDVSGSSTRRKYQVYVTGGFNVGPGVTSSLYQTVYDQDFTLQTSNPIFDMTVGLFVGGTVTGLKGAGQAGYPSIFTEQQNEKMLFPSTSLMMREKIDVYTQFSQMLLGTRNQPFYVPHDSTDDTNQVDVALFMCFKRLFSRDRIKRETFAMRFYQSASLSGYDGYTHNFAASGTYASTIGSVDTSGSNVSSLPGQAPTSGLGAKIFTDKGSTTSQTSDIPGGAVGTIVDASNISNHVGTIFYDQGIVMFDLARICWPHQHMSGVIKALNPNTLNDVPIGYTLIGSGTDKDALHLSAGQWGNHEASFIPDFVVSASIDDIVDHVASTRFQSGSLTAMTFQNVTNINSTLFFCRATPDEFNYSSNPSFTSDTTNRIQVIDEGAQDEQRTFTFPTTIGLYDSLGNLLAVAKTSRPIEKNDEKDMTFRVRLDF
jgi:hypothetical protein